MSDRLVRVMEGLVEGIKVNVDGASVDDHLDVLYDVHRLREKLQEVEARAAQRAREHGATWEEVGASLGISRQAAQQRFGGRSGA